MADEKKQYPRSKLEVTEAAGEPKSFGDRGGQVLNFRAKFTDPVTSPWLGQTFGFGCFKKDLFENIKAKAVGTLLDCDVETKPFATQDGNRLNYNITQIYVNGQPVATRQQGRYNNDDSPEKRKSIEDQNRAGHITNLWIAGKIADDDSLITKLRGWLDKLDSVELKPESSKSEKKDTTPPEGKEPGQTFADGIELVNAALKQGWTMPEIRTKLTIEKPTDIIDVDEAAKVLAL